MASSKPYRYQNTSFSVFQYDERCGLLRVPWISCHVLPHWRFLLCGWVWMLFVLATSCLYWFLVWLFGLTSELESPCQLQLCLVWPLHQCVLRVPEHFLFYAVHMYVSWVFILLSSKVLGWIGRDCRMLGAVSVYFITTGICDFFPASLS